MAAIKVLVVGDGPYLNNTPPADGINFSPTQDATDNTFTVSEFVYLLKNNSVPSISVDTAHRRADPHATFRNFVFTDAAIAAYDVLWLFGYEGWNYAATTPGSPLAPAEVQAIANFMAAGGGVFATGDHAGMGSYMCGAIPRVRTMRKWFARPVNLPPGYPTTALNYAGATVTSINWPGVSGDPDPSMGRIDTLRKNPDDSTTEFQFDDQSDALPQQLDFPGGIVHPIFAGPNGPLPRYPDHMHEGEVVTPFDLAASLNINGQPFTEYPTVSGFQPAPMVIATGQTVPGHSTQVEGSTCEQNNFTTDTTPTVANTVGAICAYDGRGANVGRVVTDSSFHHFLDLNLVGDPCGSTTDRQAGFGPAMTPPASGSVLADLQAFYVNTVVWLARPQTSFYFAVDKSTFGRDESSDANTFPLFSNSFWLVVDGHTPSQVQSAINSNSVQLGGAFANIAGISLGRGAPVFGGNANQVQRVLIPYSVQFSGSSMSIFPASGGTKEMLLEAEAAIGGSSYLAETTMELVGGSDPYFQNVNPAQNNVFYLSQDLCVFTVTPAMNASPIPGATFNGQGAGAAEQYIQDLLTHLNGDPSFTDPGNNNPFAGFPSEFAGSDSSVAPGTLVTPFGPIVPNYNFAVARVRLNGTSGTSADPVKVFFRLFLTQTNDTDYQPATAYLSQPDASGLPSEPLKAPDGETIPFFASGSAAVDYAAGGPNARSITVGLDGAKSAYFGCFLNVYDPSINLQMMGTHHCLVAQIAYDGAPIVNANGITLSPENSDKLAQRNLQITFSANPGAPASHRIPQTFDVRPSGPISQVGGTLEDFPDELMIDWGNVPHGSTASIYWPQVQGIEVVRLAEQLYGTNELSLADPHTVQCKVNRGVTYVPIPSGTGPRFAGLFTIDLPATVVKGQEFNVVVRRLSSRQTGGDINIAAREATRPAPLARGGSRAGARVSAAASRTLQRNWRYVVGTFQVKIPVSTENILLGPEENTYAILLWRLGLLSPTSRWFPVMHRYVSYIGERVNALGGNSSTILPSPTGIPAPGGGSGHGVRKGSDRDEFTGKIVALIYDRFGDFEGFVLKTERGREHAFRATEDEIEELARYAWVDRVVISVLVGKEHPETPVSIVLRRKPPRRKP